MIFHIFQNFCIFQLCGTQFFENKYVTGSGRPMPGRQDWATARASYHHYDRRGQAAGQTGPGMVQSNGACMCHAAEPYPAQLKPGQEEPSSDRSGQGHPNSAPSYQTPLTPLKVPLCACKPGSLERWIGVLYGVYTIGSANTVRLNALKHKQSVSTPNYYDHKHLDNIGESPKWSKARKPFPFWRLPVKIADDDPNLNHRCLFCRWNKLGTAGGLTNILCPWPMPCVWQGHGYKIFTCIESRVRLMHGNFKLLSSTSTVAWTSPNGPAPKGVCKAWTSANGPSPKWVW